MRAKWAVLALIVVASVGAQLGAPRSAAAAPVASCAVAAPSDVLMSRGETLRVTLGNTAVDPGYVPLIDLRVPNTVAVMGATTAGRGATVLGPYPLGAGSIPHPITGLPISGTSGTQLYVVRLPLSSVTSGLGGLETEVSFSAVDSPQLEIDAPLALSATCTFGYGATPVHDPSTDPPVSSAPQAASVVPRAVAVTTQLLKADVCQGQSETARQLVLIDVADGVTLSPSQLSAVLGARFQSTAATAPPDGVVQLPTGPGGTVQVSFAAITGGPGVERTVTIDGHVLEGTVAASAPAVVATVDNVAHVHGVGALATPLGFVRGVADTTPSIMRGVTVRAHSMRVDETATPVPSLPDELVDVAVSICVADDFSLANASLASLLPNGTSYQAGASLPGTPSGDNPTTVTFSLGALAGGSQTTVTYRVQIDQTYGDNQPVLGGDTLPTTQTVSAQVGTSPAFTKTEATSGTDATLAAPSPSVTVAIEAVNGLPGAPARFAAGDVVTFRVDAALPSGDQGEVTLELFLPPVFDAAQHGASGDAMADTAPIRLGAAHDGAASVPWIANAAENRLRFVVSATTGAAPRTLSLVGDFLVTNTPVEDGLVLTTPALMRADASGAVTVGDLAIVSAVLDAPLLTAAHTASPALGVDAGDTVTFSLIVRNVGHSAASAVTLQHVLPPGFSGTLLSVRNGLGDALPYTGDVFAPGGLVLTDPVPSSGAGLDTVVVTIEGIADTVPAGNTLTATGRVVSYQNGSGGMYDGVDAPTTVATKSFALAAALVGPAARTIGETATYTISLTVPEGANPTTTVDFLPPLELVAVGTPMVAFPTGVTGTFVASSIGSGARLTFTNLNNANRDDGPADVVQLTFVAQVQNTADANDDDDALASGLVVQGAGNAAPLAGTTPTVDLEEPELTLALTSAPPAADAGSQVTWRFTAIAPLTAGVSAHDVTAAVGTAPNLGAFSISVTGDVAASGGSSATWAAQAPGQVAIIDVTATISDEADLGSTLTLPLSLTWTSRPGEVMGERTGAGGVDDYLRTASGTVTLVSTTTLTNTLVLATPSPSTIGDLVEYRLRFTMPRGKISNFTMEHRLPPQLAFVTTAAFSATELLCKPVGSSSYAPCTLPTPSVAGSVVRWSFGSLKNPESNGGPRTLELISRVRIANVAESVAGQAFATEAAAPSLTATSGSITITEPVITSTATLTPTSDVDGGDVITVTGEVTATGHVAHEVTVDFPFETSGLVALAASSVSCAGRLSFEPASATLVLRDVALGETCSYLIDARVSDTIAASSTIAMANTVTWRSRPFGDPNARDGSGTPAFNNYRRSDALPTIVTLGGTLALTTGASTEPDTTEPELFAGERVVYDLAVTVPDGTSPSATLVFSPPPGVRVHAANLDVTGFAGTVPSLTLSPGPRQSGQPVTLTLGNVVANASIGQSQNTFHVLVTAGGTFDARNRATPGGLVAGTLQIGGGAAQPAPSSPAVELRLPAPRLTLAASRTDAGAGATFDVTATVTSAPPAGPLCDTQVTVRVPAFVTVVDPAGDGLDNDGDGATDEADEDAIAPTSPVVLPVAGCVGAARQLALRLMVTGAAPLPSGAVRAALAPYYTLASLTNRERLVPATDAFDNDGGGTADEPGDEEVSLELQPDSDDDGLSDALEREAGTDPLDADSEDDGVADGAEPQPAADSDGDGLVDALDADSDNDGLFDGTELGIVTPSAGTDLAAGHFVADADPLTTTDPRDRDSDDGGRSDGAEDADKDGALDAGEGDPQSSADDVTVADSDGDGLGDREEALLGTSPLDNDSDDDGVPDGLEANYTTDVDGDGLTSARDADSDGDGLFDGTERGVVAPASGTELEAGRYRPDVDPATRTSALLADSDRGGVLDGHEDLDGNGRRDAGETDPRLASDDQLGADLDGDGWSDALELAFGTSPLDADSDDDGVLDGAERDATVDSDGDGLPNVLDADSDDDGVLDGTEAGVDAAAPRGTDLAAGRYRPDADPSTRTSPVLADSDGGGVTDGGEDPNRNGRVDPGETDPRLSSDDTPADGDGDGLADAQELALGTDPLDADSDDDGVLDGAEANFGHDSDGDGAIGALDPDSDSDGLNDGLERGLSTPVVRVPPVRGTDLSRGRFVADADPATRTKMAVADTDRGGVSDGSEDTDHDGRRDAGETDPLVTSDDLLVDGDGDGLSDQEELALGSDPADADSDDDGVGDGAERDYAADSDDDGLLNLLDVDSDDDGLADGTELGVTLPGPGTDVGAGHFVPDADSRTRTSPVLADSDGGGVTDGNEDRNGNGRVDAGELDPRAPADDATPPADGDGDGLADAVETFVGTDPADGDSDDDGVADGAEPNWRDDHDGDGLVNALDADSDDDLLFDGTERGVQAPGPGTDLARGTFVVDADPTTRTHPLLRDTDRGGLLDGGEDADGDGQVDPGETDPTLGHAGDDGLVADGDGDGLADLVEARLGSSPADGDSDDDGVADGAEPNLRWDADGDGLPQVLDPDSDNDGVFDGTERGVTAPLPDTALAAGHFRPDADPRSRTHALLPDSDRGGVPDGFEDLDKDGAVDSNETDPTDAGDDDDADVGDTDGDGLPDREERALGTSPTDADSDDDGVADGAEPNLRSDVDGDGLTSARDADSDGDGLFDGTELGLTAPQVPAATDLSRGSFVADADPLTRTLPLLADTDGGGIRDGREDANHNGRVDGAETDPRNGADDGSGGADGDGDGLSDAEELALGTDPGDADSDDDGVLDGQEPNAGADSDGDGLLNARDADSDNDRLFDGTELGVTAPGPGTDVSRGVFRADSDPTTRTNPLAADTDGGGVPDGSEDIDRDGAVDAAPETDPNLASDDTVPSDGDGDRLPDAEEVALGTDPADADSDDDGVLDGLEPNLVADSDGDGLLNPLDPDSDDDGLFDGTELGVTQPGPGTHVARGHFVADVDPTTRTNPLAADTDGGGVPDGAEDPNGNGQVQAGELDPRNRDDDATPPPDSDGDGLSDAQEAALGTAPMDADSDDDGVLDGAERNPSSDTDRDGLRNPRDADSDDDGVRDGTELGVVASDLTADTDTSRGHFVADADPATTTYAVVRDSDGGGVIDGLEDRNSDGAADGAETDPSDRLDDDRLADSDGDGLYDVDEDVVDTDRDGVRDFLDLDSDGDTLADAVEAGDALLTTPPLDTDNDGVPDYRDGDSDGDTVADRHEAGDADLATAPRDADGDGLPDYRDGDSDGDRLLDAVEAGDDLLETPPVDTDGDGTPDLLDLDSDGDSVGDATDNCPITANPDQADENRNGIGNLCEGDDDGDGVLERVDNCPGVRNPDQGDRDNDGAGDLCDLDANGDGLPDGLSVEGGCSAGGGAGGAGLLLALALLALRRRRAAIAVAWVLAAPSAGQAQAVMTSETRDFSVERFRLALDQQGILGVEAATVPEHGTWGASLWLGYARAPLVVYSGGERAGALVAYRVASELSASLALWSRLEVGLAAPLVLTQGQDDMLGEVGPVAELGGAGLGDLRLTGKVALLGPRAPVALAVAATVTAPSSTGADYRGEAGVTVAPELLLARRVGQVRLGANLGWKARSRTELLDLAVDDELTLQLGAGLPLRRAPLILEGNLALATAAGDFLGRANQNHAEVLAGVTYDLPGPLVATLVGGLGLSDGAGTPQWRSLLALRFGSLAPGLADRDGDRLIGDADRCPGEPEDNDRFEDGDGCPDLDNDGDGIRDSDDRAPDEAEDLDGFEDGDGAPDPDNDGDGVPDARDACRDDAETSNGFDDEDGCPDTLPDSDGDGVRDVDDRCPGEREDLDGFEDGDGCVDRDDDGDQVEDRLDRCPREAGARDNAGCPDADRDGDGVVDRLDNCPEVKGQLRHKGCAERQLVALAAGRIELAEAVYFKRGRAEVEKRSYSLLDNAAAVLRAHPEVARVDIEGHTDDRGDDAENKLLSQRRAEAVVAYLVGKGVAAERLRAIGYGEEQPISDNKRSRGRAANRRVVFRIVAPGSAPGPAAVPAR